MTFRAAQGAAGALALRVGTQTKVVEVPPGMDGSFEERLSYPTTGTEAGVHLALSATVEREVTAAD
jgi:hypothetical protein